VIAWAASGRGEGSKSPPPANDPLLLSRQGGTEDDEQWAAGKG